MTKAKLFYRNSLLTKVFMLVILLVGGGNNVWGEETLTVNRSNTLNTTNKFPIAGGYVNYGARSEFIIDKDSISSLIGKNITKITLYHQPAPTTHTWGDAEFKIYLKEVSQKTFSNTDFLGSYDSPVFSGTLEPRNDTQNNNSEYEMNISLSNPFNYTGTGNLLVGVYCSTTGTDNNYVYFYGISSSNGGLYSYKNSSGTTVTSRDTYRLKTTFSYEDATLPILSITEPAEGNAFGYVTENTTRTYTVKNIGAGSMNVNVESSDAAFSVSTSSLTGITNDGTGKTFNVTFNYNSSAPQPHTADIIITPTFDGGEAQSVSVSAGPDVELNENKEPAYISGPNKSVYVKYTAQNKWNTICMPISLSGNMDNIFGTGWKAYTLSSYENNTLTFTRDNYLSTTANPYLVYVETANSPANGFVIESTLVYNNAARSTNPSGTTAVFQGTYSTKTYNALTDEESPWYGVTPSGKVMKAGSEASVKGYRAYFTGISAPADGARISIVIDDEEGETTDLGFVKMVDENAKDIYTLSGQRVQKGRKGIYIVNGRKVVIK